MYQRYLHTSSDCPIVSLGIAPHMPAAFWSLPQGNGMDKKGIIFLDKMQKWEDTINVNANIFKNSLICGYCMNYSDKHEMLTLKLLF